MNGSPQQPLDLMPIAVALRAVAPTLEVVPAADATATRAKELWVAVQSGEWAERGDAESDAYPAALAVLLKRAQSFTPRVVVESPDALLLELAGSQRLFGGLHALLAALRGAFPRPLQLAMAPTPLAAVLLARAGRNCCITSHARLQGRLASLSLRHLRWPEEEADRLRSMGIATLGELLRLPRAGLTRRIGPERLQQLDRLTGLKADPRAALKPVERFARRIDPDFESVDRERLLTALVPLLGQLEDFLRERQCGVTALRITLHHRRALPQLCIVRCVVPEYRAARFTALLAARLEALVLAAPVHRMELTAGTLRQFIASSQEFWAPGEHGGGAAATQAPEFLQTLMARLGERAVYGLEQVDEHRPERQWSSVRPGNLQSRPASMVVDASPARAVRPLGLMRVPVPLVQICDPAGRTQHLLHEGRTLQLVSGPERIESGWWDGGDVARDYYIARAADGAQWWIYRECGALRRWFVHGCFA